MNKDEIVARFQLYKHYIPIIMSIDRDLCNLVSKNSFVKILTLEHKESLFKNKKFVLNEML